MAGITTAFPTSAKAELLSGGHCFLGNVAPTGTTTNASPIITAMSSISGIALGMRIIDTGNAGIPAGAAVASIDSSTQVTLSKNATASHTGTTLSTTGDQFKFFLIKGTPTGTYGAATVNYTDITGNTDEVSGAGYTAGGVALVNTSPATGGTTAYITFVLNPTWTSATFSTSGGGIQNTTGRLGGTTGTSTNGTGRVVYIGSFGGNSVVNNSTLTVNLPVAAAATAILGLA